jgi:hypothetical protein
MDSPNQDEMTERIRAYSKLTDFAWAPAWKSAENPRRRRHFHKVSQAAVDSCRMIIVRRM